MKLTSKPHTIEAFQFLNGDTKAPQWFQDAYREGRAYVTMNAKEQYITVLNDGNSMKAQLEQWVCRNASGTLFVLSDAEIKEQFDACD